MPLDLRLDMADVKPSVLSTIEVGVMAVLFIVVMKIIVNLWAGAPVVRMFKPIIDAV